MADTEVKVIISGEAAGAIAAMEEAAASVKERCASMTESVASVKESFAGVNEAFLGLAAVLAGAGAFREIISASNEWVESVIQLGIQLGASTERASAYEIAIKKVGGSSQDFDAAVRGLTRQLRTNEKGLNDMGIATRDAAGKTLDMETILWNAIDAIGQYKEGTNRNEAAQAAFGRGVTATNAIFRLHREALQEAAEEGKKLALIVGEDQKNAFEENRKALAETSLKFEAMKIQLANGLIPAIVQLGEAFGGNATSAGEVLGETVKFIGEMVINVIGGMREWMVVIPGVFNAADEALHGHFAVANAIYDATKAKREAIVKETDDMIARLKEARKTMKGDWGLDDDSWDQKPPGDKEFKKPDKGQKGPDTRLAEYKNELSEMEQAKGDYDQKDYASEIAFWQQKLDLTGTATKEDLKLRAEISKEILGLQKKQHDEEIKIQQEVIKETETLALGRVEAERVALNQMLAMHQITLEQQLAGERRLADETYAIKKKALDDDLALAQFDLAAQQKFKGQLLTLEQQHAAQIQAIDNKAALDQRKAYDDLFKSIQSGFTSTIDNFLKGTASLSQTIRSLFKDIVDSIISSIAKMAAQWLVTSISNVVQSKTSAIAIIGGLAAQAAAGAFAATAAIPMVGPELAPAAAAAAYADTLSWGAVASLDVGTNYVPKDMLAMVHRGEAVVPRAYNPAANEGGGSGGSGGSGGQGGSTVHNYGDIHTSDTNLKRLLSSRANQRAVMEALAGAYRRGAR